MGLFLHYNLFYQVSPEAVYAAWERFFRERGLSLAHQGDDHWPDYALYCRDSDWTVLDWICVRGRESQHLEALLQVSRQLKCLGFLVYVYDGDYWGYEFFKDGVVLDRFVQWQLDAGLWLPCKSCPGDASILTEHLSLLDRNILNRYLVQKPHWKEVWDAGDRKSAWRKLRSARDVKAQPSDEFTVFDECAVPDFATLACASNCVIIT